MAEVTRREKKQVNIDFGGYIRAARESKGLEQQDIAERIGVSTAYVSFIETGSRDPKFSTAMEMLRILDLDLNDFIEDYIKSKNTAV